MPDTEQLMHDFGDGNGPVPAHRHPNGGGWVSGTARVSGGARVSGDARVFGTAQVSGGARVSGDARVYGTAQVYGTARVSGDARVYGTARVSGDARVFGDALVYGGARVSGDALVYGTALVSGTALVYGTALVSGDARVSGTAQVQHPHDVATCGPVGSRNATLTIYRLASGDLGATTGCFVGTVTELLAAVAERYAPNDLPRVQYELVIPTLVALLNLKQANDIPPDVPANAETE